MCTVTFVARRSGYLLGMNRDEKVSRVRAIPPRVSRLGDRRVMAPSEPGGGTWVGVNDAGTAFALVNWYAIRGRVAGEAISRGSVPRALLESQGAHDARCILDRLALGRINPFRLIGVFPHESRVLEWRWDLRTLEVREHGWRTHHWVSSGWDEPGAQRTRGRAFRLALGLKGTGTPEWLRRLHRSHRPGRGPFSTCMHREDARTVSYTEIRVAGRDIGMRYLEGPPCLHTPRGYGREMRL